MNPSPYIVSNWVKDNAFYGREELCQTLATGDRCVYLVGTRRIGKTSLLMRLAAQLQPHALYCDLMRASGGESLDEARLVYLVRRQLNAQAASSESLLASRPAWDREAASLCAWLEEVSWRWEELGLTVTLLWDEAEMLRRLPVAALMRLRAILQHSDSLRIIVGASKGLAELNDRWRGEYVSPFLFGFRTQYIAGLTDQEADLLIRQRGQVQVSARTADTIRAWAGNHPFLIQTLCSALYRDGRLREPTPHDLIVDSTLAALFTVDISYLSPSEQAILRALAHHGPLNSSDLQQVTGLADEALISFADGMLRLGLVRGANGGRWAVGNEFLAQWLRSHPLQTISAITDRASLEVVDAELQNLAIARVDRRRREQDTQPPPPDRRAAPTTSLSDRERAVLRLVAAGQSNPEIARELVIALDTVKAHLKNIYGKLGASNRAQAVARAKEQGLI
jgi:DNA-binding CsgD family transcriptional regulator